MLKLTVVGCGDANQENWVEYGKSRHGGKFAGKKKAFTERIHFRSLSKTRLNIWKSGLDLTWVNLGNNSNLVQNSPLICAIVLSHKKPL